MRIRYAYKLENGEGKISFVVLSKIKSDEEVQAEFAPKGCVKATFHERVRTGFRLNENGEVVPTGLPRKGDQPTQNPAASKAPKAEKAPKSKKAQ